MILKASQRGSGQNLATHLMRVDENEHVCVHELRGFCADTLSGAFREAEAMSRATQCRQYLFSLSLSPPEQARVSVEGFETTIDQIEERLGLNDQPRAIVFHEKEGRRHAHCVWSRIDAETMTARQLSFFKTKLMDVSRHLYLEHGWDMPAGFIKSVDRSPVNFTLAEWEQAKRLDADPRWMKAVVQACWKTSDNRAAFQASLEQKGYFLARGDKRGFVVLDHHGEVHALARVLDCISKDIKARLGEPSHLRSVTDAQRLLSSQKMASFRQRVGEAREQFRRRMTPLVDQKRDMIARHRHARADLLDKQKFEQDAETLARANRLPKGLKGLWHRFTGRYQDIRRQNEVEATQTRERHAREQQTLSDRQFDERSTLQGFIKQARHRQAEMLSLLRTDQQHYRKLSRDCVGRSIERHSGRGFDHER